MFQTAFQPTAFSINAFQIASTGDTARSGYWREFFYKMQEEALKSEEKEPKPLQGDAQAESKPVIAKLNAKKASPAIEKPFQPPALPPFKRSPIYTAPSVQEQLSAVANNDNFSVFAKKLDDKILNLALEKQRRTKRRNRLRRRAAAILLMAA